MTGANFFGATLEGINLQNAELDFANFFATNARSAFLVVLISPAVILPMLNCNLQNLLKLLIKLILKNLPLLMQMKLKNYLIYGLV